MYILTRRKIYWFVLVMAFSSACAPGIINTTVVATPTHNLSTVIVTSPTPGMTTTMPLPTHAVPASATSIIPENTVAPTTTPIATDTPEPTTEMLMNQCPEIMDTSEQTLWSKGSILFSTGWFAYNHADAFKPQESGIWAISAHHMEAQLAYTVPDGSSSWAYLSDDGNTLVHIDNIGGDLSRSEVAFYDLQSKEEIRVANGPIIEWNYEWLADGRVKFLVDEERIWEVGVRREYLLLDPETRQSETVVEELSLPGYQFNDEVRPHGYASVSPSGEFVLYSASNGGEVEIRLLNLMTEEILWRQKSQNLPGPYQPEWAKDNSHVLFYLGDLLEGVVYKKIVYLGSDAQPEELPLQPYAQLYPSTFVDLLTASPDQRYIVYAAGGREKQAFMVDTEASQIKEICQPDATFIDGRWVSNNLFVYRTLIEKDGQQAHALQVLDVPAWITQVIFEAEAGYGINVFGWTPIEFP